VKAFLREHFSDVTRRILYKRCCAYVRSISPDFLGHLSLVSRSYNLRLNEEISSGGALHQSTRWSHKTLLSALSALSREQGASQANPLDDSPRIDTEVRETDNLARFYHETLRVVTTMAVHYAHNSQKAPHQGPPRDSSNPWRDVVKHDNSRTWSVNDVERSDIFVFQIGLDEAVSLLPRVISDLQNHVHTLQKMLKVTSVSQPQRRCLLLDLYHNVYTKMHHCLKYIFEQIGTSAVVTQVIAGSSRQITSSNVLELYHAIGLATQSDVQHQLANQ